MFRSLTFLAYAVSALKVHQDAMETLVDALIDAHRACNDNLVASGWTDMDAWEECVDAADAKFREDCDDDADCP